MELATQVILVVEPDPPSRRLIITLLKDAGYTVIGASTGSEAIAHLITQKIDLAMLDWQLPDMAGTNLCQVIKGEFSYEGEFLPVIILTAHSQLRDRVAGLHLGADDYLIKPFEPA